VNLKDPATVQRLMAIGTALVAIGWLIAAITTAGSPTMFVVLAGAFAALAVGWWRLSRRSE